MQAVANNPKFAKKVGVPQSVGREFTKDEGNKMANTKRMNRLEELGRVDSEKAYTAKGKKNLAAEKKRVVGEIKKAKSGGLMAGHKAADGIAKKGKTKAMKPKMMKSGGKC
jgi:hypothetical protein